MRTSVRCPPHGTATPGPMLDVHIPPTAGVCGVNFKRKEWNVELGTSKDQPGLAPWCTVRCSDGVVRGPTHPRHEHQHAHKTRRTLGAAAGILWMTTLWNGVACR